ncbi:15621_t:CDS:10 [Funneliformis geosporum]|nr:15621_t:CDS:10 [Funneliformis geosporum]
MKRTIKKSTTITETIINDNGENFIIDRKYSVKNNSQLITETINDEKSGKRKMANPETLPAKHKCLVIIEEIEKPDGTKEITTKYDLNSLKKGFGIQAKFIGQNFYRKFRNREYVGEEEDFVNEFTAELVFIITEIRLSGSDKAGKTTVGDGSKYQVLGKELTDKTNQRGTVSSFDQKGGTTVTTHKGVNYVPLEALAIYHDQNEKEHDKLPETSNRKPRIANRVKIGEGLKKAYEKFNPLPSVTTFRNRVAGVVETTEITEKDEEEYSKKFDDAPPAQLMIALLGSPGLGKSFIAAQIAKALGRKYIPISLNGKQSSDVIYGTNMSNPGSDPGEITKAISRSEDQTCLILLDEIEKAGREAKLAIDLPDFVGDRFTKLNVKIYDYKQRIEVARNMIYKEFKKMEKAFIQYTEEIDKGDKDRKRMPCPYSQDKTLPHRKPTDKVDAGFNPQKCVCFINNLNLVQGQCRECNKNKELTGLSLETKLCEKCRTCAFCEYDRVIKVGMVFIVANEDYRGRKTLYRICCRYDLEKLTEEYQGEKSSHLGLQQENKKLKTRILELEARVKELEEKLETSQLITQIEFNPYQKQ